MRANLFAIALVSLVVATPIQAATLPQVMTAAASQKSTTKIDLNKADQKAITNSMKGIGKKRAEAIVNYRAAHGNFKSVEDLAQVKGLGKQFVKNHLSQLQAVFLVD